MTTNPTVSSYAAQLGTYTKVGNVVHVRGYLDISAGNIGTDGAGDGLIAGLPFTSNSDNTQNPGGWMENFKNIPNSFSSNRDNACLYLAANTTSIYLHQFNSGNPQYQTGWGIGSIDNGNRFQWQFAGSYRV